jgi:hypothetical protein
MTAIMDRTSSELFMHVWVPVAYAAGVNNRSNLPPVGTVPIEQTPRTMLCVLHYVETLHGTQFNSSPILASK